MSKSAIKVAAATVEAFINFLTADAAAQESRDETARRTGTECMKLATATYRQFAKSDGKGGEVVEIDADTAKAFCGPYFKATASAVREAFKASLPENVRKVVETVKDDDISAEIATRGKNDPVSKALSRLRTITSRNSEFKRAFIEWASGSMLAQSFYAGNGTFENLLVSLAEEAKAGKDDAPKGEAKGGEGAEAEAEGAEGEVSPEAWVRAKAAELVKGAEKRGIKRVALANILAEMMAEVEVEATTK